MLSDTQLYTVEEVATLLKIKKITVYKMIKRGDLIGYRVGHGIRVDISDLDAFIRKSKDQSLSEQIKSTKLAETPYSARDELYFFGDPDKAFGE
ncbi:MAG: excise: binding domain, excisionase family [Firmicutes bacterium]|nr:excise: binding domain, excisionase family [Bacillota bacterium]